MKSLVLISITLLFPFISKAQGFKLEKVTFGVMLPALAKAPMPFKEKPFELHADLAPSFNIKTSKTHHHLFYSPGTNSIQTMHGYLLPKKCDFYVFFSKNLNTSDNFLGLGFEKVIPVNDYFVIVGWSEIDRNNQNEYSLSFGITLHPLLVVWKKK